MTSLAWEFVCLGMVPDPKRRKEVLRQAKKDANAILRKVRKVMRSRLKEGS